MRVASVTKPMTSTMAATLVDDGRVGWDTPVVELLPDFALADPALTARLTVADLFCACTGVRRATPSSASTASSSPPSS